MKKFLEEIFEQPAALERTLQYYISQEGKDLLEKLKNTIKAEHFEQIIFTGMGTNLLSVNVNTLCSHLTHLSNLFTYSQTSSLFV